MNSPFTPEQVAELDKPIDSKKVAHRQGGGGTQLSYIEGHEAIDAANRLFGYGSWGFEVVGVPTRDHYTDTNGEIKAMWYSAKIRLHVRGCEPIEEMGLVEVHLPKPGREFTFGQQVDVAMKGAITDALKRALRCYGDQFGNSLYDRALLDGQPKPEGQQPTPASTSRPVTPQPVRPANLPAQPSPAPVAAPARPVTQPPIVAAIENDPNFKLYSAKIREAKTLRELSDLKPIISKNVVEQSVIIPLREEYRKAENALVGKANSAVASLVGAGK